MEHARARNSVSSTEEASRGIESRKRALARSLARSHDGRSDSSRAIRAADATCNARRPSVHRAVARSHAVHSISGVHK